MSTPYERFIQSVFVPDNFNPKPDVSKMAIKDIYTLAFLAHLSRVILENLKFPEDIRNRMDHYEKLSGEEYGKKTGSSVDGRIKKTMEKYGDRIADRRQAFSLLGECWDRFQEILGEWEDDSEEEEEPHHTLEDVYKKMTEHELRECIVKCEVMTQTIPEGHEFKLELIEGHLEAGMKELEKRGGEPYKRSSIHPEITNDAKIRMFSKHEKDVKEIWKKVCNQ